MLSGGLFVNQSPNSESRRKAAPREADRPFEAGGGAPIELSPPERCHSSTLGSFHGRGHGWARPALQPLLARMRPGVTRRQAMGCCAQTAGKDLGRPIYIDACAAKTGEVHRTPVPETTSFP